MLNCMDGPQRLLDWVTISGFKDNRIKSFGGARIFNLENEMKPVLIMPHISIFHINAYLASLVELPELDIIHEGDVVGGMPVVSVDNFMECDLIEHFVNWTHNCSSVLLCRSVLQSQTSVYEVILHVHNHQNGNWAQNLCNPLVIANRILSHVYVAVLKIGSK